jgi:hypothetical protein
VPGLRVFVAVAVVALATVGAATAFSTTGFSQRSPDGTWSVRFTRENGYGRLDLTQRSSGERYRMYRSNDSCCDQISWIAPHLLIVVDDYNVKTLDPANRTVRRIAGFSNFVVSPSGRLVAGWADSGGHSPQTVEVVPTAGGTCMAVPRRPDQDDSAPAFTADSRALVIERQHFDLKLGYDVGATREVRVPLTALRPVRSC